ncbi:MAG: hypothetical protein PHW14_02270 [Candidatus Omnitrophica bacterium]|nr:hypothetical protein [Candidatus Omnitrophota bacterium]
MKIAKLDEISKIYFTTNDIAKALEIGPSSAKVSANRYCAKGYILRVKRGMYILKSRWETLSEKDLFALANVLQVPSYISLTTALSYHGVTTQLQQGYIESIALKRTKSVEIKDIYFGYTRIGKSLYHGFSRQDGFFIASPEKAFLDALYLSIFAKYAFDTSSIEKGKLNPGKLHKLSKDLPERVRKEVKTWIS